VTTPVPPELPIDGQPAARVLHTPNTPTIDTLVEHLDGADLCRTFTAADTLKNVMVKTRPPGTQEWVPLGVGIPGDREVDMKRLAASLAPAEVALLDGMDFAAHPYLAKGYLGPGALREHGVRYLVDPRVVRGTAWVTGADRPDHHVVDLVCGRDFIPDGTVEAAEVRAGDPSPDGAGALVVARGIEIGHIFQLGRKYTDAFGVDAWGPDGKPIRITMGSYGIGVSRLVGAIAEQSYDEHGLIWPREVAPADVHVVVAGKSEEIQAAGERLAGELDASGLRVMLDDRPATPGVKFADAELIGVPIILVVGRGLVAGAVEVKDRATGERTEVPVDGAVVHLVELCRQ
jgi:prolyl-tRNA synthetase